MELELFLGPSSREDSEEEDALLLPMRPPAAQVTTAPQETLTLRALHSAIYAFKRRAHTLDNKKVPNDIINGVCQNPSIDGFSNLLPLACAASIKAKPDVFIKLFQLGADPDYEPPEITVKKNKLFCCLYESVYTIKYHSARQQIRAMLQKEKHQSDTAKYLLRVLYNLDFESQYVEGQTWHYQALSEAEKRARRWSTHIPVID